MPTNTRTRKPKAAPDDDTMRVVERSAQDILSLTSDDDDTPTWVDAFELDGTMYQIRSAAPPNVLIQFVHLWRTQSLFAQDFLLTEMLAPGAYEAIMNYPRLKTEHIRSVAQLAVDILMGRADRLVPKD